MPAVLSQQIEKTPEVCGGRACISGHRIRVADIVVWHERRGYAPDEILDFFPGLTLSDVHAALAYYFNNRDEIDNDLRQEETGAMRFASNSRSKLREKLGG